MIEIQLYVDRAGETPFSRWVVGIDDEASSRIAAALAKLSVGNLAILKGIGSGLFEIRVDYGPGYRVYCGRDGETLVILLGGGIKKRQQRDIETARVLWREYKKRNAGQS